MENYAIPKIFLDQQGLKQVTSLEFSTDGGKTRVALLEEGVGGYSFGGGFCTITIGYAIPKGGTEYPFQEKVASTDYVTAQVTIGAKQYSGMGQLMTDDFSASAGSATEGSVNWEGELKPME